LYECGEEYYTPYVRIKQLAGTALMLENIDLLIPSIDAGMPAVVNTIREQYTYGDSPDEIRFKRSSIEWDIYGEDVEKLKKHLAGRIAAQ
jgi:hypothetical protein